MMKHGKLMSLLGGCLLLLGTEAQAQSLQEAIDYAIHFNPDVQAQVNRRLADDQDIRQAEAGYLPKIDLSAGVGVENSRNPTASTVFGNRQTTLKRSEATVSATQNLFKGLETFNEVSRNKAKAAASAYRLAGIAQDIALDVTRAYIEVMRSERVVQIAEQNVQRHLFTLGLLKERDSAGISPGVELVQAQGRLALARANLTAVQGNLVEARTAFAKVVGIMPSNLTLPGVPHGRDIPDNENQAIKIALSNHPTLKSAMMDVEEAKAQYRTSKATNLPSVDFVLSSTRDNNIGGVEGISNGNLAMLRMSYNMFNGGADFARQRQTAYQVQEASEIKNRTILQIEETVRLAYNAYMISQLRLPNLRIHRDSTEQTLVAYREQFKIGKRSLLDVLDTENELFTSQTTYERARFDFLLSRYRILNSMGTLLSYVGVSLPAAAEVFPER